MTEPPDDARRGDASDRDRLAAQAIDRGDMLREVGRDQEGLAAYREAMRLDPTNPYPIARASLVTGRIGDAKESVRLAELAVSTAPNDWFAHFALAVAWSVRGRTRRAVAAARECHRLAPETPSALWILAATLSDARKSKEALSHAERLVALAPDWAEAHEIHGTVLLQRRKKNQAEEATRRALRLQPSDPSQHFSMGIALLAQGETDAAVGHFHEAARLEPDDARYRKGLVEALEAHLGGGNDGQRLAWLGCALVNPIGAVLLVLYLVAWPFLALRSYLRLRKLPPVVREVWGEHLRRRRRVVRAGVSLLLGLFTARTAALPFQRPPAFESAIDLLAVVLGPACLTVGALMAARAAGWTTRRRVGAALALAGAAATVRAVVLAANRIGPFVDGFDTAVILAGPPFLVLGSFLAWRAWREHRR